MEETSQQKRDYYRLDMLLPVRITVVPPEMRDRLKCFTGKFEDLKPRIVNFSGAGIGFASQTEFSKGDILEMAIRLGLASPVSVCVCGEVRRARKTEAGHYYISAAFVVISSEIRDMIVNFIFEHEREIILNSQFAAKNSAKFGDVSVARLSEDTVLPFEIYAREKNTLRFLFDAGLFYDALAREYLNERGARKIYVKPEDMPLLDAYLERTKTKVKRFDPEDPLSFRDYSFRKSRFFLVEKALLSAGVEFLLDLYIMGDYNYRLLPHLSQGMPADVLIRTADIPAYREYIASVRRSGGIASSKPAKGLLIKEEAKLLLHGLFDDPFDKGKMQEVVACADRLVDYMEENKGALSGLMPAGNEDLYPYNHMANVTVLSIGIAFATGLSNKVIKDLAIGALLHDIGFASITNELVDKEGKLVSDEYSAFKTHVMEGMKILKIHRNVPEEAYGAVLHHHEKSSGRGYPSGLAGNRISLFGKITAAADAYDILITKQPYRERKTPAQALSILTREAADYDPEILRTVIRMLSGPPKS